MGAGIRSFPVELMALVVQDLETHDLWNLSLACRHFRYLVRDQNICRILLEAQVPFSAELQMARKSRDYARALRLVVKRNNSISRAEPYLVAILAVADQFIYESGMLVYCLGRECLRMLDVHGSASEEIVIHTRNLLNEAIKESEGTQRYKFQPIHYAHGILSCLYTHSIRGEVSNWLLVLKPRRAQIITTRRLDSAFRLFVRNNERYFYFGTHSGYDENDGFKRWVLRGLDLEKGKWIPRKIQLSDMVGSQIGVNICFEIIHGYFYGVSNQTSFEMDEVTFTSYYDAFKFPVDDPSPEKTVAVDKDSVWRREHVEGPLDDRWNMLKLEKDEKTGLLMIVEGRREWLRSDSQSQRSFYKTILRFPSPPDGKEAEHDFGPGHSRGSRRTPTKSLGRGPHISPFTSANNSAGLAYEQRRPPQYVHRVENGSTMPIFTFSQCLIRSYVSSAESFIDLVNDPLPTSPAVQRLRLRVGSRQLLPLPTVAAPTLSPAQAKHGATLGIDRDIAKMYKTNDIVLWPRDATPDPSTNDVYQILTPPGHSGDIYGVIDDRSLVYSTGHQTEKSMKAVILVSFCAGIRVAGIKPSNGSGGRFVSVTEQRQDDYKAGLGMAAVEKPEANSTNYRTPRSLATTEKLPRESRREHVPLITAADSDGERQAKSLWAMTDKAMFLDIPNIGQGPTGISFFGS